MLYPLCYMHTGIALRKSQHGLTHAVLLGRCGQHAPRGPALRHIHLRIEATGKGSISCLGTLK